MLRHIYTKKNCLKVNLFKNSKYQFSEAKKNQKHTDLQDLHIGSSVLVVVLKRANEYAQFNHLSGLEHSYLHPNKQTYRWNMSMLNQEKVLQ